MSLLLFWQSAGGGGPTFLVAFLDDEEAHGMLRKNVASQSVGCQLVNASDGTAFTGAASVSVTIDNGVQGAGAGTAPAHEGNGYHSYTPTQAETNGNHIAFTFTGTGAVPRTVQAYTISYDPHDVGDLGLTALTGHVPQTGDAFVRLGAAGAGLTALGDTRVANLDATVSGRMATYTQPTGFLAATFPASVASPTNITAGTITTVTNLTNAPTSGDLTATMKTSVTTAATAATPIAASVTGAVGSVTGAVGSVTGAVGSVGAGGITAASHAAGAFDAASLATDAANEIADALLDRNMATGADSGSPTVRTVRQALRMLRNKASISAGTLTVTAEDDTTASWTAAVTTAAGDPITAVDPASA